MEFVRVLAGGKITLPADVQKKLRIKAGTRLVLHRDETRIIIQTEASLKKEERQETEGWMRLSEEALKDAWDHPEEDIWNVYAKKK